MRPYWDGIRAMREIRESRCYKRNYGTWAEYCQRRWNKTDRTIDRKIQAVDFVENIQTPVSETPRTVKEALRMEAQARAAEQYARAGERIQREAEAAGWGRSRRVFCENFR